MVVPPVIVGRASQVRMVAQAPGMRGLCRNSGNEGRYPSASRAQSSRCRLSSGTYHHRAPSRRRRSSWPPPRHRLKHCLGQLVSFAWHSSAQAHVWRKHPPHCHCGSAHVRAPLDRGTHEFCLLRKLRRWRRRSCGQHRRQGSQEEENRLWTCPPWLSFNFCF